MSDIFGDIVVTAMAGIVLYQIISGKVLTRSWQVWATRDEQPGRYWFAIVVQSIIVSILIGLLIYAHFTNRP
jgi:hypothetical protein